MSRGASPGGSPGGSPRSDNKVTAPYANLTTLARNHIVRDTLEREHLWGRF